MTKKAQPTKTINPLHFEDLDPHRFEDLIRNLIYDFKTWQSIEATGRSGSDEGFDIRAWERTQEVTNEDEEEGEEGSRLIEGNLWMIQCKRDKELGPTKVKEIVQDGVKKDSPPYGYILVAPANFSKKSYDLFREELRSRGVMEFHLWGRSELEDMLYMPKNDHILFAFFGISLVTRKRSRSTEIRFAINNKNKLLRVLSGGAYSNSLRESILVRDFNDTNYPWKDKYKDFDKKPRWKEHIVTDYHPKGLMILVKEHYAFVDLEKKKWDFTKAVDLVNRQSARERNQQDYKKGDTVRDFWRHLPRCNQAKLVIRGIIFFEDILVIDDKGDILHQFPHIFVDFKPHKEPFKGFWYYLDINGQEIELEDDFKKIKVFPPESKFPEVKKGKLYKDKSVQWDQETLRLFKINNNIVTVLFDVDGKYSFLKPRDAILVAGADSNNEASFAEITHKYETTIGEYLKKHKEPYFKENLERQVGRSVKNKEKLSIFEFDRAYEWQFRD